MIPSDPYTHEAHAVKCGQFAKARMVLVQRVLCQRGPILYCGVIKNAYTVPGGPDCWTVETVHPEKTRITIPVRNVIACGGETCSCQFSETDAPDWTPLAASEAGAFSGDGASNTSLTAQK
ncbi:MAG: hypothetical protein Q7T70_02405 [Polaromonas sp.]|nr:hypothetical protein [Polaromonas sp.]